MLGLEAVLADGTVLPMMNRMVKNNAGVDLKHLFIGSEGVLGIVTRVVLKLHPLPRGTSTALVALAGLRRRAELPAPRAAEPVGPGQRLRDHVARLSRHRGRGQQPLRRRFAADYPVYVLTDMHCGQPETDARRFETMLEQAIEAGWVLDAAVAQSVADAEALWAIRDGIAEVLRDYAPTLNFDVSVPVGRIGECVARMRANLERDWPQLQGAVLRPRRRRQPARGGVQGAAGRRQPARDRRGGVWRGARPTAARCRPSTASACSSATGCTYSRTTAEIALMRTLKRRWIRSDILNPGKML